MDRFSRLPTKDPRTVARDIPGFFDILLPSLTTSVVSGFNRQAISIPTLSRISDDDIRSSKLKASMLFEIAYSRAEQLLNNVDDWDKCFKSALAKQERYFDFKRPPNPTHKDFQIAETVAVQICDGLEYMKRLFNSNDLVIAPKISGMHWISSSHGDFSLKNHLIEIKCTSRNFGGADYKQLIIYWLLMLSASLENDTPVPEFGVLFNPRRNTVVRFSFEEFISIAGAGISKLDLINLFGSLLSQYNERLDSPI